MSNFDDPWKQEPTPGWDQPPPLPGAPAPTWQPGASTPQTNGLAVASLVCGILIFFCYITWIPALITGYMGRNQIDASGGMQSGREMAIIGIVLGYVGLALTALMILFVILAFALAIPVSMPLR